MSIHAITEVLASRLGSPERKLVAFKLADVADDEGAHIEPSIAQIAEQAEISAYAVAVIVKDFCREGLLIERGGEYGFDFAALAKLPSMEEGAEADCV